MKIFLSQGRSYDRDPKATKSNLNCKTMNKTVVGPNEVNIYFSLFLLKVGNMKMVKPTYILALKHDPQGPHSKEADS